MAVFKFRNLKSGQATPVPPGEFTIGRAEDAYVQVDDPSISRHHARLINDDQGFFVEDLGSANGVVLRGAFVTGRNEVKFGDLVHIGKVPFRIDPEVPGEASASPVGGELRKVDRAFMRRETERIPSTSEAAPAPKEPPASTAISFSPSMAGPPPPAKEPSKSGHLVRHSVPLPTLVQLTASASAATAESGTAAAQMESPAAAALPAADVSTDEMPWWWWMVVFLAGLGSGLLLGLFFAKLFFDMGGRPASLP